MVLIRGSAVRRPASDRSAVLHGALMWLQNWISDGESALRLRTDLPYFAEHCLKLRTKSGAVEPFILNPAQLRLHALLEEQRRRPDAIGLWYSRPGRWGLAVISLPDCFISRSTLPACAP